MPGPSLSLRAQLLTAFVLIVVVTTAALTFDAYESSLASLEAGARLRASAVADGRAQALERMIANRQRRAEGFLAGARELCGEPTGSGSYAWALDCMEPMLESFRAAEGASGAYVTYQGRRLAVSGMQLPADGYPRHGTLSRVSWVGSRPIYIMRAKAASLVMTVGFGGTEVTQIFGDASNLGERGEVLLLDRDGRFLTAARFRTSDMIGTPPGAVDVEPWRACGAGPGELVDVDYRGVRTLHAYEPVLALEGTCVDAHVNYDEALAPAEQLRMQLLQRGALFIIAGALLSLFASHRIAAPVQRLATAARGLRSRLDEPIPVSGPSEVRALGRALREAADDLAALVGREQAARREAQAANSTKDRFLAAVSHELRTPLTAILGWARVMRSQPLPASRSQQALEAIERSAQVQRRLIEDLLDVSRVVAGQLRVERQTVQLAGVIDLALDAIRPQAIEKNIEIKTVIEDSTLAVAGDAERLQQVVWNLASNAVKFTPAGGSVLVLLKRRGAEVQLSVRDNGAGIAEEFLPHVFDWFRQGDTDSDKIPSGLGLGLGIVRQLVEAHGGTVHAESEGKGFGARFVVTLPLDPACLAETPTWPLPDAEPAAPVVTAVKSSFDVH